ncbi:hypothetical protein J32TS6_41030 [Virgibacillus pantothenticus]|uniref:DUF1129 domain-containing protein n=1 Tax=Virgibacillus pantothenticus TaxID=1473 RepID=A0A0L0QSX6_VIRPA|nr:MULTISPECIES: DUF1129 family protein [Virgibacillus]API91680.1 hypothetical protein BKP57_07485 [Virgibacillus sp. 6R]KNE21659.1 hypothetical protein AFK71_08470 [Virgibacillus pantothenticus]MBS7427793.1 DUF1129 family protein [Virgibacillus sp. 19R1-5]MBU8568610.1 DUF1129 family protein [Virgibacillus pantothenticus]MBU8602647.1 DUF1129 family protein [Virgibacillus pantothenticus]
MNASALIELNNEKRTHLNEANLAYYENMLIYIRSASNKSEQQTEELLLELLEHLLQAQSEGKNATDIFGSNPKAYCEELIQELPKEKQKPRLLFVAQISFQTIGFLSLIYGIIGLTMYYFFQIGAAVSSFYPASIFVMLVCYLIILYLFIKTVFWWLKRSTFAGKQTNKWIEFIQAWLGLSAFITLFVVIMRFTPRFGPVMQIPTAVFIGFSLIFYFIAYLIKRKEQHG